MNTKASVSIFAVFLVSLTPTIPSASTAPPSPFVGDWLGVDAGDLSDIRLAIAGSPSGPFSITWTESFFGGCDGEAGIVRGTGSLSDDDPNILVGDLHFQCFTTGNAVDVVMEWRYDPVSNTISSGDITWHRHGVRGNRCLPPPAGMTGWWPGDGDTLDIVGGLDGVFQGDPLVGGSGLVHLAFSLDGSDDFVDVPHDGSLDFGAGDFTLDLWVLFKDTAGEQVLVEKWIQRFPESGESPGSEGWTLTKLEDNVLLLAMADGSGVEEGVASDVLSIATNTWYHFAATRAGSHITLFVNGLAVAEGESSLNLDSGSSLKFGHRGNFSDTPGSESDQNFYLNGRIDEVEVFTGLALSHDEIRDIYDASTSGKCKAQGMS